MRSKRRGGIVFHGGSLAAVIILSILLGILIGLMLPGPVRTPDIEDSGGEADYVPPAPESEGDQLQASENTVDPVDNPAEEVPETPSDTPPETPLAEVYTDEQKISDYIAAMSLREKICQMLIVTPDALTGVTGTQVAGPKTQAALEKYPVGGLIHFSQNISGSEQIITFNAAVQSYAKTPLFIATDEEGGRVGRLKSTLGAHSVGAMLSYESGGTDAAFGNAKILADTLKEYGFNTDFAPVADVWSNPENTAIGDRAYSADFENAATLVAAAVRGFNESGIVCSLKHFPGHGDTREDSHNGAAYVTKTLDELRENELKPFKEGIAAGADMVMAGHLTVPHADELPATLSNTLITGVLRNELGFSGVVITDSLAMSAMSSVYSTEFAAVTAVSAGVDILLMPNGIERTITALTAAIESGEISESRIDESVTRIITLKAIRGIIEF